MSVAGNDFAYLCRQFHNLETHRQRDTAYQVKILPRHNGVGWRPLDGVNGCVFHYFYFFRRAERIRPGVGLRQTDGGLNTLSERESLWRFALKNKHFVGTNRKPLFRGQHSR